MQFSVYLRLQSDFPFFLVLSAIQYVHKSNEEFIQPWSPISKGSARLSREDDAREARSAAHATAAARDPRASDPRYKRGFGREPWVLRVEFTPDWNPLHDRWWALHEQHMEAERRAHEEADAEAEAALVAEAGRLVAAEAEAARVRRGFERWQEAENQLLAERDRERRAAERRQRSLRETAQAAQEARRAAQQAQVDWLAARWWRRPFQRAQQAAFALAAAAAVLLAVGAVGAGAWYVVPTVGQPVVEVARGLADLVPGPHREPLQEGQ